LGLGVFLTINFSILHNFKYFLSRQLNYFIIVCGILYNGFETFKICIKYEKMIVTKCVGLITSTFVIHQLKAHLSNNLKFLMRSHEQVVPF